jgi:hypothetical protein
MEMVQVYQESESEFSENSGKFTWEEWKQILWIIFCPIM